jgi:hypothetical protein
VASAHEKDANPRPSGNSDEPATGGYGNGVVHAFLCKQIPVRDCENLELPRPAKHVKTITPERGIERPMRVDDPRSKPLPDLMKLNAGRTRRNKHTAQLMSRACAPILEFPAYADAAHVTS